MTSPLYVVTRRSTTPDRTDEFHLRMFHGTASRGGRRPDRHNALWKSDVDLPLRLHKNVFDIANVFCPENELVVSELVRSEIQKAGVIGIRTEEVLFETLYSFPYRAGDFSFWSDLPDYNMQREFIDRQTHHAALMDRVGSFFRIAMPTFGQLRATCTDFKVVLLQRADGIADEYPVSQDLVLKWVAYNAGGFIMDERLFRPLSHFLSSDYFETFKVDT